MIAIKSHTTNKASIKSRLHRLLRSSMSQIIQNQKSIEDMDSLTTDTQSMTSIETNSNESAFRNVFTNGDPYADVRERMEDLRHKDKVLALNPNVQLHEEDFLSPFAAFLVYFGYLVSIIVGRIRDVCAEIFRRGRYVRRKTGYPSDNLNHYAALLKSWENFFTRRIYHRVQDALNRPIASNPGAEITVLERVSDDNRKTMKILGSLDNLDDDKQRQEYVDGEHFCYSHDGKVARKCINLGSYNYLGFADDWAETCAKEVKSSLIDLPVSVSSARSELGTTKLHREVEETVAEFLGKEDALVLNMGFNTNATTIPALVGPGDLVVSDELNHSSIVSGTRASGASVQVFRHNDMESLETVLRNAIINGRPRTQRPWNKILVIVEGIYSMEGEFCDLRGVVKLTKKYGAYVYIDEAHSVGAMGPNGRGIAEYLGVDTKDIDIMMGTFTKSFGGMGGYIAANKDIIDFLRKRCSGSSYHNALSPVVCQQVITSFRVIMGQDGTDIGQKKLQALRDNSNYFRMRLREMGLQVLGQYDSPIMPVMLFHPGKISGFSRECLKRGLAVVVVGSPAVPLLLSRARFCISAGHTREQLDHALKEIDQIADILNIKYSPNNPEAITKQ